MTEGSGRPAAETIQRLDVDVDLLELPPGTRIGRYELLEVLGQGSFGITYRARDIELHRDVAIKEYLPGSFSLRRADGTVVARSTSAAETFIWGRQQFIEEARTLAKLESVAGIVNVHDIVSANGTAYMVMEYVRGRTLESILRSEGTLSQQAIERLLPPLLDGLERVHAAGFLHRDIKPANILIAENGRPSLIDFGASRMALQGRTQTLTAVYTPGYAAFEQFTSAKQGPPADIYALGATLHHAVTGTVPPGANDRMIEDRLVSAVAAGKGRYAAGLLAAIDAALRLKAADRPQTIEAWRRQLTLGHEIAAASPGRSRRWPLVAAIGVVVVGLAASAPFAWERFVAAPQRAAAEKAAAERTALEKERAEAEAKRRADDAAAAQRAAAERTAEKLAAERAAAEAETKRRADQAAADPAAASKPVEERLALERNTQTRDCASCPEMVAIPSGSFLMGVPEGEDDEEAVPAKVRGYGKPRHLVTIDYAFSLGRYEVTREQFAAFVEATGYQAGRSCWVLNANGKYADTPGRDWRNPGIPQTATDPVVCVSWHDAQAYAAWLRRTTGKDYRLPSEAEWEYAARAGTTTPRFWGDREGACLHGNFADLTTADRYNLPRRPDRIFMCSDGYAATAPVGRFRPNAFGLHDMLGNAWEWTNDCWNANYVGAPVNGASWTNGDCASRVARGGSWYYYPWDARAGFRDWDEVGYRRYSLGFRVARTDANR